MPNIENLLLFLKIKLPYMKYTQRLLLKLLSVFIALTFITYSCKKLDITSPILLKENFSERFFTTKTTPNKEVAGIIEQLKKENEKSGFVNKLPKNCGLPVWNKLLLQKQASNTSANTSNLVNNIGDSSTRIIIPLTLDNTSLSSVIIGETINDTFRVNCYTTNGYLYNVTHGTDIDTTKAMNDLTFFFYVENRTFGTTTFYNIPNNLFSRFTILDIYGNKTITIKNDTSTNNNVAPIVWICVEYQVICSECHQLNCAVGNSYTYTICTPIGGGGGGPTGGGGGPTGGGGGPTGGGSGGGGGPTGGGGYPCPAQLAEGGAWYNIVPIEPNPCGPPPPPPPVQDTILDPCSDVISLQNSASFISYMQELKDSSNSNREYGYFLFKDSLGIWGNTATGLLEGPANKLSLPDFINPYQIDGIAHSHFDTNTDSTRGLSVFSPDDLWTMCTQFNGTVNGSNVTNPTAFTIALVTKRGTQYLIKIENLTKFRAWSRAFTTGNIRRHYIQFHQSKIFGTNTNEENEIRFLQYIQRSSNKSGLKLFRGNSNFTEWQPIRYINGSVVNAPCQ